MNKKTQSSMLTLGFALLLPGLFLASISQDFESSRILHVIGLVLIVAASAVFGASISARTSRKK